MSVSSQSEGEKKIYMVKRDRGGGGGVSLRILELFNPFEPEFRKNSFNPAGKLQLFRSVKLIETHGIMKITKKFTLYKIEWIFQCYM